MLYNTQFKNVIDLAIAFYLSYNENEPVKRKHLFDLRKRHIVVRRRTMLFWSQRFFSITP